MNKKAGGTFSRKILCLAYLEGLFLSAGCTSGPPVSSMPPSSVPTVYAPTPTAAAASAASPDQVPLEKEQESAILQDGLIDLDLDGKTERVQLRAGKDLTLEVDGDRFVVYPDFQYTPNLAFTTYEQPPKFDVIEDSKGEKRLLVSVVWATNKIGSTAGLWLYKYDSANLHAIWTLDRDLPATQAVYNGGKTLETEMPPYPLKQRLSLTADDIDWLRRGIPSDPKEAVFYLPGTTLNYGLRDYDGDGNQELLIVRGVCLLDCPHYFSRQYLFFEMNGDTLQASKSYFASPVEQEIMEKLLLTNRLSVDLVQSGLSAWFQESRIDKETVREALDNMVQGGVIRQDGNNNEWRLSF